jgi:type II secretory pathway component PulJ
MLMKQHASRQAGFGLVEMMIGILVGLIVVAAATSMLSTTMASSNDNIKMTRLDQEMRQVMTMLSRDLKRATLWDPAADVFRVSASSPLTLSALSGNVTVTSSSGNLGQIGAKAVGGTLIHKVGSTIYRGTITGFSGGGFEVTISTAWPAKAATADGVPAGSWNILRPESAITTDAVPGTPGVCVLITYDTDASGTLTSSNPNERFGYRYDATNDAVEIRTSGTSSDTCTTVSGWENLTDDNTVQITAFSITDNSPATVVSSGFNVNLREYTISITGNLKSDTSVVRTLQETIRVRNDQLS